MSQILSKLVHRHVEQVRHVHDYVQLRFDDGAILNVFNSATVSGGRPDDLSSLVGVEVAEVSSTNTNVCLVMADGNVLTVGMADADYRGPEAMEYIAADGGRVVWS